MVLILFGRFSNVPIICLRDVFFRGIQARRDRLWVIWARNDLVNHGWEACNYWGFLKMNNEQNVQKTEVKSEEELAETIILSDPEPTDYIGDASIEINVEQLIADIEGEKNKDSVRKQKLRRKLEDMAEERSFEDTYAIEFDS